MTKVLLKLLAFVGTIGIATAAEQNIDVNGYHRYSHATFATNQCPDILITHVVSIELCTGRCNRFPHCTALSLSTDDHGNYRCYLKDCGGNPPKPAQTLYTDAWVSYAKDNPSRKPTDYHANLNVSNCMNFVENEQELWRDIENFANRQTSYVKAIMKTPNWNLTEDFKGCHETKTDFGHNSASTLNTVHDYSQIKDIREASKAAYRDIILFTAHFNIIIEAHYGSSSDCWHENLNDLYWELKDRGLTTICSIAWIIKSNSSEAILTEVISVENRVNKLNCGEVQSVVCDLLDHALLLSEALLKFNRFSITT